MLMTIKLAKFSLSEFVLLDEYCQEDNLLVGRIVIQHVLSYTIAEIIVPSDLPSPEIIYPLHRFQYIDMEGERSQRALAIHFSLAMDDEIGEIVDKIIKWYCD